LYIVVCVFLQFSLFGIIADRKRKLIEKGLQEKKERDIRSGKEAEKAAMADKQILDVMDEEEETKEEEDLTKKEEAPQVLVIGADGSDSSK
jgi:phosphopantothenoylcysteine synthetase/decarboxylase